MEKKREIENKDFDLLSTAEDLILDYHGFNLKTLAEKIRLKSAKPKPKMIFY